MKKGLMSLAVACVMVAGLCMAADAGAGAAPKHDAAKGPRTEWKGDLSAAPAGAAADVLAVLTVKRGDTTKTYNLTSADADVVAKLKDGATKASTVVVKGELSKDETAIAVTKVGEPKAAGEKKAGGHHEKVQK